MGTSSQFGGNVAGAFGVATIETGGSLVPAILTYDGVVELATLIPDAPASVRGMLAEWDAWCDRIAAALEAEDIAWMPSGDVDFAPPLPDAGALYMAGANYSDHLDEMAAYTEKMNGVPLNFATGDVFHFLIPASSMTGTGHQIVRPAGVADLDWEVELAAVIGRRADSVSAEHALDIVAGYTVVNDVSWRGPGTQHPVFGVRFLAAKGRASFTPMGPAIVPARFISDPGALDLTTRVNGTTRQDSNTGLMVVSLQEQIAYLSRLAPLLPGDIICTGTPAGTAAGWGAYLDDGDVIEMSIEGIGTITNRLDSAQAR
jgi:2-keto-4-pentenoate hydratase/2-oxohepta-3-ene-1,7-dioic acid hydratase in catechol pathway